MVPGPAGTGKTELAKLICMMLSMAYQKENPYFLFANTVDCLRANQTLMRPGVPVLLDDIGGVGKDQQLIYSSISMWKAILAVKDASQNRARNNDLMWAARQPKVLTTNCTNLDECIMTMFPDANKAHKDAVRRRVAELEPITESLYVNPFRVNKAASCLPRVMSPLEALDLF